MRRRLASAGFGAQRAASEFEALAHDPVQDQRHEADAGVGLDALGQTVEDGGDLDLGLEYLEAPLDIGQGLVALHDLGGTEIGHVGHQHQLAVHECGTLQGLRIERIGEHVGLQVDLDDAAEVSVADLVEEARLGTTVGEACDRGASRHRLAHRACPPVRQRVRAMRRSCLAAGPIAPAR